MHRPFVYHACILVAFLATLAIASSGDRSPEFRNCISTCAGNRCHPWTTLPVDLRLTRWTCVDDCKYNCMHMLTDNAVQSGKDIQQYYGKWPFWRFMGIQEPASVVFSLWNMWSHIQGARQIRHGVPVGHPMRLYYLVWAYVSINAWIWSAVFHTRDLPRTEKLDYFSAALAIMYALYLAVTRMLHLYPRVTSNWNTSKFNNGLRPSLSMAWAILCIVVYIAHVTYLSILPRFDYSYNMTFNLALGVMHNLLWLLYSLPRPASFLKRFPYAPKSYRPSYAYKAGVFVALTTAATALELFDFPPVYRILDAHALWHLSTAPIARFWYDFLVEDALDEGWRTPQHSPD